MQNNHSYLKKETRQHSFICKIAFIYNSEFFDIYQVLTKTELIQSSLKENFICVDHLVLSSQMYTLYLAFSV